MLFPHSFPQVFIYFSTSCCWRWSEAGQVWGRTPSRCKVSVGNRNSPWLGSWLTMIYQAFVNATIGQAMSGKQVSWRASTANVASWLVARLAIVARNFQIIQNPWFQLEVSLLWQDFLADYFCIRKMFVWQTTSHFSWKKPVANLPFQKGSDRWLKHLLKNSCSTNVQGTGPRHWAQFTLVGLFSRFGIAENFSGGDPGAKKERNAFYESTLLFLYIFFFFFLFIFVFLFLFFYILLFSSFFFSYSFSSSLSSLSFSFSLSLSLFLLPFLLLHL